MKTEELVRLLESTEEAVHITIEDFIDEKTARRKALEIERFECETRLEAITQELGLAIAKTVRSVNGEELDTNALKEVGVLTYRMKLIEIHLESIDHVAKGESDA